MCFSHNKTLNERSKRKNSDDRKIGHNRKMSYTRNITPRYIHSKTEKYERKNQKTEKSVVAEKSATAYF